MPTATARCNGYALLYLTLLIPMLRQLLLCILPQLLPQPFIPRILTTAILLTNRYIICPILQLLLGHRRTPRGIQRSALRSSEVAR